MVYVPLAALLAISAAAPVAVQVAPRPAAPAAKPAARPKRPAPGTAVAAPRFELTLPPGWRIVPERSPPRGETRPQASMRLEDGTGRWLLIWAGVPATDGLANPDAVWELEVVPATGAIAAIRERDGTPAPCLPRDPGQDPGILPTRCPVGDGRLDLFAIADLGFRVDAFWFGDAAHEAGVDLADFRAILLSYRPVRPPEP
jgi:hypothetical protein